MSFMNNFKLLLFIFRNNFLFKYYGFTILQVYEN